MAESKCDRPRGTAVIEGKHPSGSTTRWVAQRKAEVVAAVERGELSATEVCERYHLSTEELISWRQAMQRKGIDGLTASSIRKAKVRREERST